MSNYDITENMNDWEYAMYNMRRKRQDRINALVKKYGYPINENNLLPEDYYEYDSLKSDLEAMETTATLTSSQTSKPMPHGSSLDDEDMAKNAEIVKRQKDTEKSNYKLSLNDLASIALDTLKYTPEAIGEMLADGIIAKEYLQAMKKTNKKLIDKYGKNTGAADGTDNYYHALLQCQYAL